MDFSYKNHKKHKVYPDGCMENEKTKEIALSMRRSLLSQILSNLWEFFRSKFPF